MKVQGSEHEKFISSFNICGAVFQKYGYMKAGGTTLTGKGMRNNTRHRLEVESGAKNGSYRTIEGRLWSSYIDRRKRELSQQESAPPPPGTPPNGNPPSGAPPPGMPPAGGMPPPSPPGVRPAGTTSKPGGVNSAAPKAPPPAPAKPEPKNLIKATNSTRKARVTEE